MAPSTSGTNINGTEVNALVTSAKVLPRQARSFENLLAGACNDLNAFERRFSPRRPNLALGGLVSIGASPRERFSTKQLAIGTAPRLKFLLNAKCFKLNISAQTASLQVSESICSGGARMGQCPSRQKESSAQPAELWNL